MKYLKKIKRVRRLDKIINEDRYKKNYKRTVYWMIETQKLKLFRYLIRRDNKIGEKHMGNKGTARKRISFIAIFINDLHLRLFEQNRS